MNRARIATCEGLENRRLLSVSILVQDGTLIVRGTKRADHIQVSQLLPGGGTPLDQPGPSLYVTINGRTRRLDSKAIHRVHVDARGGDDLVQMSEDPFYTGIRPAVIRFRQTLPTTILGGAGNDTLIGAEAADSISGGLGNDLLAGSIGNDTIDGDANNDTITGSSGNDLLRGGNGHDRILADDAADTVQGGGGFDLILSPHNTPIVQSGLEGTTTATLETLPEFGYAGGVLTIFGTRRADNIAFTSAFFRPAGTFAFQVNNRAISGIAASLIKKVVVKAKAGDDSVQAGPESLDSGFTPEFVPFTIPMEVDGDEGNDTIIGGWGADILNGGQDDDQIAGALGDDVINGGIGNDTLRGNAGADAIVGRDGTDSINGGPGNDTVVGDDGVDQIFGGTGADTFESTTDSPQEWKDKDSADMLQSPAPGLLPFIAPYPGSIPVQFTHVR
ncbi:MAG: Hemolysin-type calcium-binding region [Phycisphaerales bacterium]|nr:Hemolysin-type calcium-binding region [Phycisphaerales bacterium]